MALLVPLRASLAAFAIAVAAVSAPMPADAGVAASDWVRTEAADVRLVSALSGTAGRETLALGLEFRLAEGWKVYWRSAGDVGFPPQLDWTGSTNLASAQLAFPVPRRFSAFGIEQFGYAGHVVYPLTARLAEPGAPVALRATVNALLCSEICVPLDAGLALDLPAAPARPTPFTQLLDRWSARVPADLPGLGLDVAEVRSVGDPARPTLLLRITSNEPMEAPDVFPEGPEGLSFGRPDVSLSADRRVAELRVPVGRAAKAPPLAGTVLTLTLRDGDRFAERPVTVAAVGTPAPSDAGETWLAMLGVALLGGMILNLMPCVLPVLSLKLMSAVGYGGADRGAIRRGFLASAAGILASFLLLAVATAVAKTAGVAVGWGLQFQQPVFLAAMTAVVLLFAGNLWGLFEVALPRGVADLAGRLPAAADARTAGGGSLLGHFATGTFATLLATPCSAPFVGTALGFALARGPIEIVAVFAAMGAGLAAPYLAVAAFPGAARMLPRPGRWMVILRRVLAVALLATAAWLLWVLGAQTGTATAAMIGVVLLCMPAAITLLRTRAAIVAGMLAIAAALGIAAAAQRAPAPAGAAVATATWQDFDEAAIRRLVSEGRVVLVDVTADWCLTCKVNKAAVLDRPPVADRLDGEAVIPMRADWTNPDSAIADYLAGFGRYGIPFNAVYGPAAPQGIALPELLTDQAVLDALRRASGAATARLD